MRWVKSKKELGGRTFATDKEKQRCYEEFTSVKASDTPDDSLDSVFNDDTLEPPKTITINGNNYFKWVTYNYDALDIPKNYLNKKDSRDNYEIFCGGWLEFYDTYIAKVPAGKPGSKMYFFWRKKTSVTIYIDNENAQSDAPNTPHSIEFEFATPPPAGDPPAPPPPPPPSSSR